LVAGQRARAAQRAATRGAARGRCADHRRHAESSGGVAGALRRAGARSDHRRARARRTWPHRGPGGAEARHQPASPLSPHGETRYQGIPRPSGLATSSCGMRWPESFERRSMAGRAALWLAALAMLAIAAYAIALHFLADPWLSAGVATLLIVPAAAW